MKKKNRFVDLIENNFETSVKDLIFILLAIFVLSAVFGFIYEMLFYRIDLGHFTKRGTTFGPWIPIYGYGGLLIFIITYHFKRHPLAVFLLSSVVSGTLEFLTGYILYHAKGTRLWDYNVEIWNFGNIGGYVCLRSILFFGVSGLLLIYVFKPVIDKIYQSVNKTVFRSVSLILALLFIADIVVSDIIR